MHIVILGAGVTGVTAAYFLGRAGHSVEVIDRQSKAAMECSYANGGQLSYSHAEPWANPYVFPKLFKWMFQEDAPLVLRFSADPQMIKWGLRFLWNCRASAAEKNARTMLRLGLYSREKYHEILSETGVECHHSSGGILHVYSNEAEFEHAQKQAEFQQSLGCEQNILNWDECKTLEPSLADADKTIYGGIHSPLDESGDLHQFSNQLAAYCEKHFDAVFHYDTEIMSINAENNEITHVTTNTGNYRGDKYVMALGAYSAILLKPVGIDVPVYPMKGYSITFEANDQTPTVSITDDALKIVYSRLGERIRCAGTAEFAGYNTDIRYQRTEPIRRGIRTLFPGADLSEAVEWACLRPSTPDGPPIVGKNHLRNLFLHTGHGTLGWTQSHGTAKLLADIIDGNTPEISLDGLELERF